MYVGSGRETSARMPGFFASRSENLATVPLLPYLEALGAGTMIERKSIARTPREHFMQRAEDEMAKFVRKEIAFQKADRAERAMKLRLPVSAGTREPVVDR
jgi:hypothetical protein